MTHLLDTDTCVFILRRKGPGVLERSKKLRVGDAGMSVVTYLELVHGAWKSASPDENLKAVEALREIIPVLPLEAGAAEYYGVLRSDLERAGTLIGPHDMLLAAHAMSLGLAVVTHNTREFSRIRGLRLEDWTK